MRKHFRATGPRARAARSCLGAITGSLMLMGLTACGGGGSDTTEGTTSPQSLSDAPARAQAMPVTVPTNILIKDAGSSTALPTLQPWTYVPPTINGRIHYIDSIYSTAVATDPARDGTTPAKAWGNIRDFQVKVLAATDPAKKLQAGDAILFKCGGVWREGLELRGYTELFIGTYQSGLTGPRDCPDDQLPTLRASSWGGAIAWQATESNTVFRSGEMPAHASIFRMFRDTIPLPEARHPNADSAQPFFLADELTRNTGESDDQFKTRKRSQFKLSAAEISLFATRASDLADAVIYIKPVPWLLQRTTIKSYDAATGVVTLASAVSDAIEKDAGYYLAGKRWMMDQPGDWAQEITRRVPHADPRYSSNPAYDTLYREVYYKPADQTLNGLEFTWNRSGFTNYNFGINIQGGSDIEISRIRFEHQEQGSVLVQSGVGIKVSGIESLFAREYGISIGRLHNWKYKPTAESSSAVVLHSNKIRGAGGYGIKAGGMLSEQLDGGGTKLHPITAKVTIQNNLVMATGMNGSAAETKERTAIRIGGPVPDGVNSPALGGTPDAQALNNLVLDSAGGGIILDNGRHGAIIDGNTVVNACLLVTDCGGIYANNTIALQPAAEGTTSARISNNIVVGVKGNIDGARVGSVANRLGREQTFGIYLDDGAANVEVFNNQISHASGGIYLHNTAWTDIHHNTVKRVTLGSIKVNSDRPQINNIEQMRGNVIRDNTLFSHRAVDSKQFTTGSLSNGIQGDAPQVYAQLWVHDKSNPSVFFTGDRRNESRNNTVVTHSKVQLSPTVFLPSTWRTNSAEVSNNNAPQTTQSSGGIWWMRTQPKEGAYVYNKELALPEWLKVTQSTAVTGDTESSPVSYRPFALTLGNGGDSLIDPIAQGSRWTWIPGTPVPYATGTATCGEASVCAAVTASQSWHTLISNPFTTTQGQLYFVKYTLKQGSIKGVHNATVRRDAEPNRYAMVGEYLQNVEMNPNELRYYEHFFRGNDQSGANTVLHLKPSDGAANYTTQYFSNATVHKVDAVAVLPGLDQLGVTAVNASSNARSFSCADLGLSDTQCSSLRDEDNQPVGPSVQVNARTMKRLYVHLPTFSN